MCFVPPVAVRLAVRPDRLRNQTSSICGRAEAEAADVLSTTVSRLISVMSTSPRAPTCALLSAPLKRSVLCGLRYEYRFSFSPGRPVPSGGQCGPDRIAPMSFPELSCLCLRPRRVAAPLVPACRHLTVPPPSVAPTEQFGDPPMWVGLGGAPGLPPQRGTHRVVLSWDATPVSTGAVPECCIGAQEFAAQPRGMRALPRNTTARHFFAGKRAPSGVPTIGGPCVDLLTAGHPCLSF